MKAKTIRSVVLTAVFGALGVLLPFITAYVPTVGKMLLPMHIPVLLCGLICGPWWGMGLGLILPLFRSFLIGMPPLWPDAFVMTFELAAYGAAIGLMYRLFRKHSILSVYISLMTAMIAGRIVWGIARSVVFCLGGVEFSYALFISLGFVQAIPGIALQLILIPFVMSVLERFRFPKK